MFKTAHAPPPAPTGSPCNAQFVNITPQMLRYGHCCYEVWKGDEIIYIGVCEISGLGRLPDAHRINKFNEIVSWGQTISIVIKSFGSQIECQNKRNALVRTSPTFPVCNGTLNATRARNIVCEQDGKVFASQGAVAREYGIHQGNLSKHLRGYPGFVSIHGKTFRYTEETANVSD